MLGRPMSTGEARNQRFGGGGIADLRPADEEQEQLPIHCDRPRLFRPVLKHGVGIARRLLLPALLEAEIGEIGRRLGDQRIAVVIGFDDRHAERRSEEHTSELQSLMRISYAVFCLKKKNTKNKTT